MGWLCLLKAHFAADSESVQKEQGGWPPGLALPRAGEPRRGYESLRESGLDGLYCPDTTGGEAGLHEAVTANGAAQTTKSSSRSGTARWRNPTVPEAPRPQTSTECLPQARPLLAAGSRAGREGSRTPTGWRVFCSAFTSGGKRDSWAEHQRGTGGNLDRVTSCGPAHA